jgi:hypothetical protein
MHDKSSRRPTYRRISYCQWLTSHAKEINDLHPDIPFTISHEEVDAFRIITREYDQQIKELPLAPLLPRRRRTVKPIVTTPKHTFVHTIEHLVDFTLLEIEQPLGLIPDTPAVTPPTSNYSELEDSEYEEEESDSKASNYILDYMGDNNENN